MREGAHLQETSPKPDGSDVSVVMACYTEARLPNINAALESLHQQSRRPTQLIVAVDNNKSLADRLRADHGGITVVLNNGNRGASSTRNRGFEVVTTPYTAFLDDDETADRDWLLHLTQAFTTADVVGTGGKYETVWRAKKPMWFPDEFAWVVGGSYAGLPTQTTSVRNVWSGNMAVRTDIFLQVGGFRTDFGKRGSIPQPEDTDLCIRMAEAAGGHWVYVPEAIIHHEVPAHRASLRFFLARCFAEGYGKALMAHHLGSNSATRMERAYARRVVGAAARRLRLLRWSALVQGLVMVFGLLSAGAGYLAARGQLRWPTRMPLLRHAAPEGTTLVAAGARMGESEPTT
jgi:GT2 family glycosyltransferase